MSSITAAILVLEIVVFLCVVWFQIKNSRESSRALEQIDRILGLKNFDPSIVTPSDMIINQFDRMVESPLDKIRSFSNGALVIGIGGTMALFFLEAISVAEFVVVSLSEQGGWLQPSRRWWAAIFAGLLLALLSSLIGVLYHLHITSRILTVAHDKVSEREAEILDSQAQDKIPGTRLSEQLEELTRAWNEAETADLIEMIPQFLQGQTSVMQEMQVRFERQQVAAREVVESQIYFTRKIDEVLGELNENSRTQQESVQKIQESHQNLLTKVSDSLGKLINERESLTREIESLPESIRESLDVDRIDEIFGRQAENYVLRLADVFKEGISRLEESLKENQNRLSNKLLSQNREIVDFFDDLQSKIEQNTVRPLRRVAMHLDKTADTLPEAAHQFGEELRESVQILSGIPEKLEEAGMNINEVVSSTASEALSPVSDRMNSYIETVEHTHKSLEKIIRSLIELIRGMVKEMEGKK